MIDLLIEPKIWPTKGNFTISRSSLTQIETVWVTLRDGKHAGRGECRPYARYGDDVASVTAQIESLRADIGAGMTREVLQSALPAGPARNAIDCAMWDLACKRREQRIWEIAGLPAPQTRQTAFTLSLGSPQVMAKAAKDAALYPVLKLKIGADDPLACIQAVGKARPDAKLIIDANEALSPETLPAFCAGLAGLNIALIEQPIPAGTDIAGSLPSCGLIFCADESLHTADDLPRLKAAGYRAVNVKLDKCGGLTAAIDVMRTAKTEGFIVMAGCMVASSLAMAPIMALERYADFIDLDGPLLLARDCEDGLTYDGANISPPRSKLWG